MPLYRSNATATSGTNVTSKACNVPSGVVDGDVLLLFVGVSNTGTTPTITTPGGWTLVTSYTASADFNCAAYWRKASSEPASYTISFSSAKCAIAMLAYQNAVGCLTAGGTCASSASAGSTTAELIPSITPGVPGCMMVGAGYAVSNFSCTPDGAMTERVDVSAAAGGQLTVAEEQLVGGGSTGTRSGTWSSAVLSEMMNVAIYPPGGGALFFGSP